MSESRRNPINEAAPTTYYRRELPSNLTPFASGEGKLYFKEALNEGYAEGYFGLVGNFTTQSEPECKSIVKVYVIIPF